MEVLMYILLATIIDSLLAFVGVFSLLMKEGSFEKLVFIFVSFAAGSLLGGAFFHLLEESIEKLEAFLSFQIFIIGFVCFFILERVLRWRHCHKKECKVHPFSYLILIGDGVHNFIDGFIIAVSFLIDIRLGIVTTLMIIFHEIPQELGDFAVLVYGGFEKRKALLLNFISQLTCIFGALCAYFYSSFFGNKIVFALPFAAGGFAYIATSDLIPELHREENMRKSTFSLMLFLFGILFMMLAKMYFE